MVVGYKCMMARPFIPSDKDQIDSWYASRNMEAIPSFLLPKTGFIVDGLAAGFLYLTDSKLGMIENYITPKDIDSTDRAFALDLVTESLIKEAEKLDIYQLIALTQNRTIFDHGIKHGFYNVGPYQVLNRPVNTQSVLADKETNIVSLDSLKKVG